MEMKIPLLIPALESSCSFSLPCSMGCYILMLLGIPVHEEESEAPCKSMVVCSLWHKLRRSHNPFPEPQQEHSVAVRAKTTAVIVCYLCSCCGS